jgi:hypothetical protein
MYTTGALLYLINYDYEHENYEDSQTVRASIYKKLQHVIKGGKEPCFENSHCWGYTQLCQAFALIKNKKELWNLFSNEEKERITQLMRMFLFMWNWGCNKYNHYRTGAGMRGNFCKVSSPNYELNNNALIIYIIHYFYGRLTGEPDQFLALNEILRNVHYDTEMEKLKNYGFMNAHDTWTTRVVSVTGEELVSVKDIFNNGGEIYTEHEEFEVINPYYLGYGKGVKINISYWDERHKDEPTCEIPHKMIKTILDECFSGVCTSTIHIEDYDFTAGLKDGTVSPYEGREGMMHEFNLAFDGVSRRSSIHHCIIDFILVVNTINTLKKLNIIDVTKEEYWPNIQVGMEDFLYKYEHGYNGFSLGYRERDKETDILLQKDIWQNQFIKS